MPELPSLIEFLGLFIFLTYLMVCVRFLNFKVWSGFYVKMCVSSPILMDLMYFK